MSRCGSVELVGSAPAGAIMRGVSESRSRRAGEQKFTIEAGSSSFPLDAGVGVVALPLWAPSALLLGNSPRPTER